MRTTLPECRRPLGVFRRHPIAFGAGSLPGATPYQTDAIEDLFDGVRELRGLEPANDGGRDASPVEFRTDANLGGFQFP